MAEQEAKVEEPRKDTEKRILADKVLEEAPKEEQPKMGDAAPTTPPALEEVISNLKLAAGDVRFPGGPMKEVGGYAPKPLTINYDVLENTLNNARRLSRAYRMMPQIQPMQTTLADTLTKWGFDILAKALAPLDGLTIYYFKGGLYDTYLFAGTYADNLITVCGNTTKLI